MLAIKKPLKGVSIILPTMFIAHGSPMIAIEESEYGHFLDQLSTHFEKPKAIVIFSAHWESRAQMVSDVPEYTTIYDFGGFPQALYQVTYPAKGDTALSEKIQSLFTEAGISFQVETKRGLDHGSWTILRRMYPKADIPVIAMSVNQDLSPAEQFRIGQALAPLRKEGVLIIGSGVTVHNFQLLRAHDRKDVQEAVREFEQWLDDKIKIWDLDALFQYETKAPHARLAVPPSGKEHFVPLFYAMGAADKPQEVKSLHRSWLFNVMTNSVFQFQ